MAETMPKETLMVNHDRPFKIPFLCTGNSARRIFSEYLIRRIGGTIFQSYSAGIQPTGSVNPFTLRVLTQVYHVDASEARSKDCEEFQC
jgi:protein-tyrosine-phosphatase